ncbi:natural cytotoxicity triggering receptor 3 ligand 1-like, partial [Pyxicephalus adspersus]|uniref:natural cytotoxicity triggering receptor 3 ligand 1-like n=1 Tax=Pyxicephalus adspersus TaxID=30357 RepID=UPI003B596773
YSVTCCPENTTINIVIAETFLSGVAGGDTNNNKKKHVTIPCVLSEKNDPRKVINLDLSTDSVRWDLTLLNGSEHKVHLFTNGVSTSYRPNSNVDEREFKRGIASLTLHNVQKSDEGEYRCVVYVSGNKLQAVRTLEVSAKPVVTLSSKEVTITLGNEQSVICYIDKFYPESVKIRWEKHSAFSVSALDKQTCTSVPTPDGDGTFNVTSLMSVKPSSLRDDGDQYSCIVSHRSLKSDYAVNFTVTVQEPPTSSVLLSVLIPILILVVAFVISACFIFKKLKPVANLINIASSMLYSEHYVQTF